MGFHVHGAYASWYEDCITPSLYFTNADHYLTGATIRVSSLIDIAFNHPYEHRNAPSKKEKTSDIVQHLKKQLSTLASVFVAMSDSGHFIPQNLCQNFSTWLLIFIFVIYFLFAILILIVNILYSFLQVFLDFLLKTYTITLQAAGFSNKDEVGKISKINLIRHSGMVLSYVISTMTSLTL